MKKTVFALAIALITLAACKDGKTETTEPTPTTTEEQTTPVTEEQTETKELENIITLTVADHREDCVAGVAKQKCMLVKEGEATEWELFYNQIEGFNYEEGFEYKLEVKVEDIDYGAHTPADAPTVKYTLVKEISKEKKSK
ncbi:MAG: DUF4377 domain-containing protein [Flavobacteriaceae bacterium]|nr:DUF4377 domain-containing protein [Flavobacteriaceae bacterium]